MKYYEGIASALQKGECFSQGNYCVNSEYYGNNGGYETNVFYYGHKVFTYILKPIFKAPDNEEYTYDFCGFVGKNKTTRLINYCLKAVKAKYRVHCHKGKVFEVPVSKTKAN